MLSRVTNSIFHADSFAASLMKKAGDILTPPLQLVSDMLESFENIDLEVKKHKRADSTLKNLALQTKNWFITYHKAILKKTADYSKVVENNLRKGVEVILWPLKFSKTTNHVRELIAKTFASVVRVIMFLMLQIYHAIPYLLAAAVVTGGVLLYCAQPVSIIAILTGGILLVHLYEALVVERAVEILEEKGTEIKNEIGDINVFSMLNHTRKRISDWWEERKKSLWWYK